MAFHFCTISSNSHLYKAQALYESLRQIHSDVVLHLLLTEPVAYKALLNHTNIQIYQLQQLQSPLAIKIKTKYAAHADKLRWSLKSVFMHHLLEQRICSKVIYTDNDIAFFNDYSFLFEWLNTHPLLLTPHHYPRNPLQQQHWLETNFKLGIYNAGFVGANEHALNALEWWAECCHYRCEKNFIRGLFDDQKYLDLLPAIEPQTLVLPHQGCNVAGWNTTVCKRTIVNNQTLINGKWPVVFIHFNLYTFSTFARGDDELLQPYLDQYVALLKQFNPAFEVQNECKSTSLIDSIKMTVWRWLDKLN